MLKRDVDKTDPAAVRAAIDDPKVRAAFVAELDKIGRKKKFNSYERVRKVYLDIDPFTIDNELLTPTMKLKRPQTAKVFRQQIDAMYAELDAEPSKAKL